jgi:hypothetical protein
MCEFTGTRTLSNAAPGRCTNTSGYLAQAEINELIMRKGPRHLYDPSSNSDVIIYNGTYWHTQGLAFESILILRVSANVVIGNQVITYHIWTKALKPLDGHVGRT